MTEQEYRVQLNRERTIYIKIELLDMAENIVDEIQGICTGGNISVDGDSTSQRNCDIQLVVNDNNLIPQSQGKVWLDKKFRPYIGIKDIETDEIVWFEQGVFYMNNPKITSDTGKLEMSIQGLDKKCLLDGKVKGSLQYITKIPANTPFFEAIKNVFLLSGETKFSISDVDTLGNLPYDIEKKETETIDSILKEIKELYMAYEYFFDRSGRFVWRRIKDRKNDLVDFNFDENQLVINSTNEPNFENVRNDIMVYGKLKEDKSQPLYHLEVKDNKNIFSIDKVGKRPMTVADDKILSQEQAQIRAEYEAYIHGNLCETINFSCVPVYNLEPNMVIQISGSNGISGRYRVTRLNIPLGLELMNVTAMKLYYSN